MTGSIRSSRACSKSWKRRRRRATRKRQTRGSGVSALPAGKAELVVELWPFAYSTSYWHHILDGPVGGSLTGVVAFLSPSAHPGSWVAARRLAQDVFVCARRFSKHARRHAGPRAIIITGIRTGWGARPCPG